MRQYERVPKEHIRQKERIELRHETFSDSFETHWHEFYEMELICAGNCDYVVNGVSHHAVAGDLFFLTPVDFHSVRIAQSVTILSLKFDGQQMDDKLLFALVRNEARRMRFSGDSLAELHGLLGMIERECERQESFGGVYLRGLLNAAGVAACRAMDGNHTTETGDSAHPARRAALYMQLHFQEPLTLADIAESAGKTASYLSGLFHRYMGVTVKGYLTGLRLSYAAKMLTFSQHSVTDICYASGFGDFSCFWRAFSAHYGCSPRDYRTSARRNRVLAVPSGKDAEMGEWLCAEMPLQASVAGER